jgi:D-amino-acid dehydrogenase
VSVAVKTRVAVIGAGIVGVTSASFLLRKGHDVVLLDPESPAAAPRSATRAVSMAHRWCQWRCQGPSATSASGSPTRLVPFRCRHFICRARHPGCSAFVRAGTAKKVTAQAQALRTLLQDGIETLAPLLRDAGARDLVALFALT